jgi:predicted O-methyltransferase YrrM
MTDVLPDDLRQFVETMGPAPDAILAEMAERGRREAFPTVGPAVGGLLYWLATLTDARRVFEFGSGYGYSAYWVARALPTDGEVVLTEHDPAELADAREYFERGGYADRAVFEDGDAFDALARHDGPFDLVLVDCQKERYPDAFDAIAERVRPGGVVVADNVMAGGGVDMSALLAHEADGAVDLDPSTAGVAQYLAAVREHAAFETTVLPLGEGIALSARGEP